MNVLRSLIPRRVRRVLSPAYQTILSWVRPDPHAFLRRCRAIIHVGANQGQERDLYHRFGLDVLWIEALPDVYEQLVANLKPYPRQTAIHALLANVDGRMMTFHVASNQGASSSLLELASHKDVWPEIHYVEHLSLPSSTLDSLLDGIHGKSPNGNSPHGNSPKKYDGIVLDTQGSELMVLEGARRILQHVSFVKTEAADFEAYAGCASVDSITEFLSKLGFKMVQKDAFAAHPVRGHYFELLFERPGSGKQ